MRVVFVCYGNICRSPMAEFIFKQKIANIKIKIEVDSCGFCEKNKGKTPDPRTLEQLKIHNIHYDGHVAKTITIDDFYTADYLVCMDDRNITNINKIKPNDSKATIKKILDFKNGGNVEDPYVTLKFDEAFKIIDEGCSYLLQYILEKEIK